MPRIMPEFQTRVIAVKRMLKLLPTGSITMYLQAKTMMRRVESLLVRHVKF